jgi:hypothetical protein
MTPTDPAIEAIERRLAAHRQLDVESSWRRLTGALAERAAVEDLLDVAVSAMTPRSVR